MSALLMTFMTPHETRPRLLLRCQGGRVRWACLPAVLVRVGQQVVLGNLMLVHIRVQLHPHNSREGKKMSQEAPSNLPDPFPDTSLLPSAPTARPSAPFLPVLGPNLRRQSHLVWLEVESDGDAVLAPEDGRELG